ncbi:SRPBCC family protein [Chryseobacterium chendengshani]|uniref:SRPBCC family protein n=1 Tax=unclassified Chryseobacterium TaxID=2593645 RepID=UPI001C6400FC|nr:MULTISPECIES: SRPBCC domain-containing protein [unclassified Chryseobacterium]MBW7674818.1 SRPBCC domain-containing protein [Chryseobacterium sp. LJ756]MBW8523638.1 SRPBCC domain-containing protein [Chryseobacterium sp. LJ668]QYK15920.1 SRPBCC domain-containing protein [Chryseobacterium sp. LJ668]
MEILEYTIEIDAAPEKVWTVLWDDTSYRQWTSAFCTGSFYIGTWEENSMMKFFDPNNNGMYSRVLKNDPNKEMVFIHLGEIYDGVEVPKDWGDATESYFLEETENGTKLTAKIKASEEFKGFFEDKFPVALQNVKHLSENQL